MKAKLFRRGSRARAKSLPGPPSSSLPTALKLCKSGALRRLTGLEKLHPKVHPFSVADTGAVRNQLGTMRDMPTVCPDRLLHEALRICDTAGQRPPKEGAARAVSAGERAQCVVEIFNPAPGGRRREENLDTLRFELGERPRQAERRRRAGRIPLLQNHVHAAAQERQEGRALPKGCGASAERQGAPCMSPLGALYMRS